MNINAYRAGFVRPSISPSLSLSPDDDDNDDDGRRIFFSYKFWLLLAP
jgi:hypothetical protein